ncbi:unnamed protein product [Porites evermanni]|uniref:Death domain-containing protein n=1 Tax=Porites evermanni TaxID=104178 RepID=A0ABN8SMH1_9CNID|nr:unnamed protein product [Porites evermanni]
MSCIPEFRKVLFSLCQELTTENLRSLKYLLRDLLTTRELEDIRDPMDLMLYLEQRNELCSNNCQLLEDLLTQIKRKDLVQKIQAFQGGLLNNHKTTLSEVSLQNKTRTWDCVTDGREGPSHPKDNSDYFTFVTCTRRKGLCFLGNGVMLRDVSAEVYERLGFLLNPAAYKNWIYLAGKLNYTHAQVSNFKLFPGQSTQMLLEDWATAADSTVAKLYHVLKEMGRADAAGELEPILAESKSG